MRRGDPHDPLLRQVLPLGVELDEVPGYSRDPVGDLESQTGPGVLHKYAGRALLVTDRRLRRPLPILLPPTLSV